MVLPATCTAAEKAKVAPKIGVMVEEVADSGEFKPVGCCITGFTPPALSRTANVDDTCLNIVDCDDPTAAVCEGPPYTSAGSQDESTFQFTTSYIPNSETLTFLEASQQCGEQLKWMLCYANGAKQILECAWVKSITPDQASGDSKSLTATVTLSICGAWVWQ